MVIRHASFQSRLSSPSPLGRTSSIAFDGWPPKHGRIFHFLLALVAWWRGRDDVPNEYVVVVSSIIILNTRHEIPRWWRPLASMGKSVDILWPNWQAHARGILPRWTPWLYWPSLGLIPGVSGKCQDFHLLLILKIFTRYFKIISLLSSINEL